MVIARPPAGSAQTGEPVASVVLRNGSDAPLRTRVSAFALAVADNEAWEVLQLIHHVAEPAALVVIQQIEPCGIAMPVPEATPTKLSEALGVTVSVPDSALMTKVKPLK